MGKRTRIILYSFFGFVILVVLVILIAGNSIVKNKLENYIQHDLPENIMGSYDDISVKIFAGSVSIDKPVVILKNKDDGQEHTFIKADKISVSDISYRKLLFSNKIVIGKISINKPFVRHYKDRVVENQEKESSEFDKSIIVKEVQIARATIETYEGKNDSLALGANDISVNFKNLEVNESTIKRKIPLIYDSFEAEGESFFIKSTAYENLTFERFRIEHQDITINNIRYFTKFTRQQLSEIDPEKREFFDLDIKSLAVHQFDFESLENEDLSFKSAGISIDSPDFTFYINKVTTTDDPEETSDTLSNKIFPYDIALDSLKISNAKIQLIDVLRDDKESVQLETENLTLKINDITVNAETVARKIPLDYGFIAANGDSVFVNAGTYENLTIKSFSISDHTIKLNDLLFKTKYSRLELSRIIPVERDHYDLSIPMVSIENFDFGFADENRFFAKLHKIVINTPNLNVYRDKLVRDDRSFKPLYARSLRQLPFDLTVDSIKINDGNIKYTERTQAENNGGFVSFKNVNADIARVGNTFAASEKTVILVNAFFMDQAPLKAEWSFDVQNQNDQFVFKGELGRLDAKRMNNFTEPNLRVRMEGLVQKTYFTIDGNNNNSKTDMKMSYSDFKVEILKKNNRETRKFLSGVANLFLDIRKIKTDRKFRDGSGEADRNKTQSVFNQLWISVESALKNIIL